MKQGNPVAGISMDLGRAPLTSLESLWNLASDWCWTICLFLMESFQLMEWTWLYFQLGNCLDMRNYVEWLNCKLQQIKKYLLLTSLTARVRFQKIVLTSCSLLTMVPEYHVSVCLLHHDLDSVRWVLVWYSSGTFLTNWQVSKISQIIKVLSLKAILTYSVLPVLVTFLGRSYSTYNYLCKA